MKRYRDIILVIVASTGIAVGQTQGVQLNGQYTFEKRGMSSMFVFEQEGAGFVTFRIGDLASTYGEGTFELQGNSLILHYDSAGVSTRVSKKHHITPTGTDTLALRNMTSRKFEIVLNPSGYVETYRKTKDPMVRKH